MAKNAQNIVNKIAKDIINPRHTESDNALLVTALVLLLPTQSPTELLRSTPTRSPPTSTLWLTITLAPC